MPMYNISMCSNTLYMSKMDDGSSFRQLSASIMTWWHHFGSTRDTEPLNLSQVVWITVWGCYPMPIDSISMCSNTLYMSNTNMDMGSSVWGSCQPQPWHNDIILTPQVTTSTPKSEPITVGETVQGCCYMQMNSISMCSNTLYMSNKHVGSSFRWLSASTMT